MNPQEYQKRVKDLLEGEKTLKKAKEEFDAYKLQEESLLKAKEEELKQKPVVKEGENIVTENTQPKENIDKKISESNDEEVIRLRKILTNLIKEYHKKSEELYRRERGILNKENFIASRLTIK